MKYLIVFLTVLLSLPASGQPFNSLSRKTEIEECTKQICTITEFRQIADSLQMSIDELCDYPVIFLIKKPLRISSGLGMRIHPVYRIRKFHTGIDIPKTKGTLVYATGNGIVTRKGCSLPRMTAFSTGYYSFISSAPDMVDTVLISSLNLLFREFKQGFTHFYYLFLEFILRFHGSKIE